MSPVVVAILFVLPRAQSYIRSAHVLFDASKRVIGVEPALRQFQGSGFAGFRV